MLTNNHDSLLIKIFFDDTYRLSKKYLKFIHNIKYINIKEYLYNRFDDLTNDCSYREILYRILKKIEKRPVCKTCGNYTKFNPSKDNCYNEHCSKSCTLKDKNVINKQNLTKIKKYGSANNTEKMKLTSLMKYGVTNPAKSQDVKEKTKQTCLKKYGTISALQNDDVKQKTKNTNKAKYGNEIAQKSNVIKQKIKESNIQICLQKYGVDNVMKVDTIKNKAKSTCLQKYEAENISQSDFYKDHITEINKKKNNTKRKDMPLYLTLDWEKILYEYNYYKTKQGNLKGATSFNYIIKYYQQNVFYKQENELIKDPSIKEKLISNRCKYLNKSISELTHNDLILGFKRSGIYYGYSHFNPLIFKYFINKYNVKKCYDPCGGWGHRLLGSNDLDLYIYNDLSYNTYKNVKRIINELNIKNTVCYNEDANSFIPNYDFDSMFTCPPYFNLEHYECGDFESLEQYNKFIDNLFGIFYNKDSCKIFGLVIREDLLPKKYTYNEKFEISNKKSAHLTKSTIHNNKEYLYIFNK